jgi:hypothetical protein
MKWWVRLKQLKGHRWLPFFLPVVGTLLYIALAVLMIPSEIGDKPEGDAAEVEKPVRGAKRSRAIETATRPIHGDGTKAVNPLATAAPPGSQ